ncbi:MAG: ThiF family adenylyltransferase, partial [Comamonas sp.]
KVESIRAAVHAINPEVRITALQQRADAELLDRLLPTATVVLDCCDNYRTRHLVNAACVRHRIPLVAAAALRFDAQLMVVDPRDEQAPCYACVFPPEAHFEEEQCSTMGVFAPLVGTMGSLQAAQALQLIAGCGQPATGRLIMF